MLERYPDDVKLIYKNFPLDSSCNADMEQQLHPSACRAAAMARCAGVSDPAKFWEFHDAIFQIGTVNDGILDAVADELGVSGEPFDRCVASEATATDVRTDVELAAALGLTSTPTIFINGREAPSYAPEHLSEIIDHLLATE